MEPYKDNDAADGIKGDHAPCESDDLGAEAALTTPDTKNEDDNLINCKRNEDYSKKSDKDCCDKGREHVASALMSEFESESHNMGTADALHSHFKTHATCL